MRLPARAPLSAVAVCLLLAACGKGASQADALDRAAAQSDPAAAASLRNQADAIRDGGSDANLSAADSPAQAALANAGQAAANSTAPVPGTRPDTLPDPMGSGGGRSGVSANGGGR